jgi:hypothetical protein
VLKNKHQAVSQGVGRFGKRSPPAADEHLQKPHNAGSRPQAQFFNTLIEHNRRRPKDQEQRSNGQARPNRLDMTRVLT